MPDNTVRIRATPAQVRVLREWADNANVVRWGTTYIEIKNPEALAADIANMGQFTVASAREARTLGMALRAIDPDGRHAEEVRELLGFRGESFEF